MHIAYSELARRLRISPLQVLIELAAMQQPWDGCWPECDDGFEATIHEQRRVRLGLPPTAIRSRGAGPQVAPLDRLPVSEAAAAILNKLVTKGYGLKPVKVFTLTQKWVHSATERDIRELVDRGNLEWTNAERQTVNLVADRMGDTEAIVDTYRRRVPVR